MTFKPLLIGFSLLAFAGAVQAQQQQQQQQRQPAQTQQKSAEPKQQSAQAKQQPGELRVSNLKDMKVVNAKGEDIGDISDVVIDLNSGRVHAVVLEFGGVLGVGEENFAFPITELKPGKQENQLVMGIDKQALENRDGFAKSQWPGMDDKYWSRVGSSQPQAGTQSQAGQESQAAAGGSGQGQKMNLVRASELIDKEVQDKSGKEAGEVQDVVVGLQNGEVRNFVVSVQGGGRAMVPAKALKMSGTDNRLVLDMSADQLRSQAKQAGDAGSQDRGPGPANPARTR